MSCGQNGNNVCPPPQLKGWFSHLQITNLNTYYKKYAHCLIFLWIIHLWLSYNKLNKFDNEKNNYLPTTMNISQCSSNPYLGLTCKVCHCIECCHAHYIRIYCVVMTDLCCNMQTPTFMHKDVLNEPSQRQWSKIKDHLSHLCDLNPRPRNLLPTTLAAMATGLLLANTNS